MSIPPEYDNWWLSELRTRRTYRQVHKEQREKQKKKNN